MGHHRHDNKHWATGPDDNPWQQHRGHGREWDGERGPERGERGGRGRGGRGGPMGGPPPWMAGLFGLGSPERGRGPRVRRGDVRAAIIDVLATAAANEEPVNGYQVIQQIAERSNDAWRPSPGSVYPTIQQLLDEGLVENDDEHGRRTVRLTAAGLAYAEANPDELAAVWTPFEKAEERESGEHADLKPEIGQVMGAVWQIVTSGSDAQRRAAVDILVDTRRKLYGVLADGHDQDSQDGADGSDA